MTTSTAMEATAALARALTEALDLPRGVRRLMVTLEAGKPAIVEYEYLPIEVTALPITELTGRFKLVAIDEKP